MFINVLFHFKGANLSKAYLAPMRRGNYPLNIITGCSTLGSKTLYAVGVALISSRLGCG